MSSHKPNLLFFLVMSFLILSGQAFAAPATCFTDMDLLRKAAQSQAKTSALNQAVRIFDSGPYRGSVLGDKADAEFSEPRGTILLTLAWLDGTEPHRLTLNVCEKDGKISATDQNGRSFTLKTSGTDLVIRFGLFSSTFKALNR